MSRARSGSREPKSRTERTDYRNNVVGKGRQLTGDLPFATAQSTDVPLESGSETKTIDNIPPPPKRTRQDIARPILITFGAVVLTGVFAGLIAFASFVSDGRERLTRVENRTEETLPQAHASLARDLDSLATGLDRLVQRLDGHLHAHTSTPRNESARPQAD